MALVTSCKLEKMEIFKKALPIERMTIGAADSMQNSLCLHFGAAEYIRWLAITKMKPNISTKHLLPYLAKVHVRNG